MAFKKRVRRKIGLLVEAGLFPQVECRTYPDGDMEWRVFPLPNTGSRLGMPFPLVGPELEPLLDQMWAAIVECAEQSLGFAVSAVAEEKSRLDVLTGMEWDGS